MRKINLAFMKGLWRLTREYWRFAAKWRAGGLLAAVIGLTLGNVYLLVRLNEWNNEFYNALQHYNQKVFFRSLGTFTVLAAIYIIIAVYGQYLQQMLEIKWRGWMTEHYLQKWLQRQNYYRMQLYNQSADNPDQRISEDIRLFVASTLNLSLGFLKAVVVLVSFTAILWRLSGRFLLPLGGHQLAIPGYMVWAAFGYAVLGTWLTAKIGRPLVRLNFEQQRYEADFRFSLVRLRENSEGVAFYRGESREQTGFGGRFQRVVQNFHQLMRRQKKLTWFTSGYGQIAIIFPFLVAAPRFFSRQIQLGGLIQTAAAFGKVQESLSFFVDSYASLAEWQAVVDRLTGFNNQVDMAEHNAVPPVQMIPGRGSSLTVSGLEVGLPDGAVLLKNLQLELKAGDSLLITGPSGAGKSSFLRALAGIWPFAKGRIEIPAAAEILFLPQKPYLPLGSLRDALLYPGGAGSISAAEIKDVLTLCRLDGLTEQLDTVTNWSQLLSLGEQQRIAFARALLQRPQWLFMDEATSALDEPTESWMYELLAERLKGTAIISVAHRRTLDRYHRKKLHIAGKGQWSLQSLDNHCQTPVPAGVTFSSF